MRIVLFTLLSFSTALTANPIQSFFRNYPRAATGITCSLTSAGLMELVYQVFRVKVGASYNSEHVKGELTIHHKHSADDRFLEALAQRPK